MAGEMTKVAADKLLADRVASSRALGGDPELAMHGGGNTSVKVERQGRPVLHVKGSGWDLATIEEAGLPGLWLDPLLAARNGRKLTDTEMVSFLRGELLDASAPNPSIEALLHAFLPARFVDHGHASAVLAIANQPDEIQREIVGELFGDSLVFLPYVFPGFDLSIAGGRAAETQPQAEGMWLAHHGLFTWGDTAAQSLDRFRACAAKCAVFLADRNATLTPPTGRGGNAILDAVAERLRPILAGNGAFAKALQIDARGSAELSDLSGRPGLTEAISRGTVTPDHVIRIKPWPLVVGSGDNSTALAEAVARFGDDYRAYFEEHAATAPMLPTILDDSPRAVVVSGAGLIGLGRTQREAEINADLAEQNVRVVHSAEALGRYTPVPRAEQFLIEYWELEQAKLKK